MKAESLYTDKNNLITTTRRVNVIRDYTLLNEFDLDDHFLGIKEHTKVLVFCANFYQKYSTENKGFMVFDSWKAAEKFIADDWSAREQKRIRETIVTTLEWTCNDADCERYSTTNVEKQFEIFKGEPEDKPWHVYNTDGPHVPLTFRTLDDAKRFCQAMFLVNPTRYHPPNKQED